MTATRPDGRAPTSSAPSPSSATSPSMAAGSCSCRFGDTRVLCTASIDEDVPRWMRGKGKGWVTAEYSMLPGRLARADQPRGEDGKQSGRTQEIQRLIGRSLRVGRAT